MSIKETIAKTKYCPILSLFLKAPTNCLGRNCMFWTEMEDREYGWCDIKMLVTKGYLFKLEETK